MYQLIIVIHVLLGLGIIGLILIQHGKGADAGATFGAGASGSVFGAQGAGSFLTRTTAIFAALFFVTSLGLSVLNSKKGAAYDFMNPSSEEQTITVPNADIINNSNSQTLPQPPTESIPVAPVTSAPVVNQTNNAEEPVKPAAKEQKTEIPTPNNTAQPAIKPDPK